MLAYALKQAGGCWAAMERNKERAATASVSSSDRKGVHTSHAASDLDRNARQCEERAAPRIMNAPTEPDEQRRQQQRSLQLFREMAAACPSPVPFDERLDSERRECMVEFMEGFCHGLKLRNVTHGLAVAYYDRVMRGTSCSSLREELVAMACVLIAAKFDSTRRPSIQEIIDEDIEGVFAVSDVKEAELGVLTALDWRLHDVTPHSFLCELQTIAGMGLSLRLRADSFAERSTYESQVLQFSPAVVAVASVLCGRRQLFPKEPLTLDHKLCVTCGVSISDVERCVDMLQATVEDIYTYVV